MTRSNEPRHYFRDTEGAAEYLFGDRRHRKALEAWRITGMGPRYAKAGRRVLYRQDWLDTWIEERSFNSTAEAKAAGIR